MRRSFAENTSRHPVEKWWTASIDSRTVREIDRTAGGPRITSPRYHRRRRRRRRYRPSRAAVKGQCSLRSRKTQGNARGYLFFGGGGEEKIGCETFRFPRKSRVAGCDEDYIKEIKKKKNIYKRFISFINEMIRLYRVVAILGPHVSATWQIDFRGYTPSLPRQRNDRICIPGASDTPIRKLLPRGKDDGGTIWTKRDGSSEDSQFRIAAASWFRRLAHREPRFLPVFFFFFPFSAL